MAERKGIKEGPPIWVESLMTPEEWKQSVIKYPATCHLKNPPMFFKSDMEWRWHMGKGLEQWEINNINNNIDFLMTNVSPKTYVYVDKATVD